MASAVSNAPVEVNSPDEHKRQFISSNRSGRRNAAPANLFVEEEALKILANQIAQNAEQMEGNDDTKANES